MDWNAVYRNPQQSSEFKNLKHKIWLYNNYIPPLPTKPHPMATHFKEFFECDYKPDVIACKITCPICNIIMFLVILNNKHYIDHAVIKSPIHWTEPNVIFCTPCNKQFWNYHNPFDLSNLNDDQLDGVVELQC